MVEAPSIHLSIKSAPLALVFFCERKPLLGTNFYNGWRRFAMVMIVNIVLMFLGGGRWKDDGKLHLSIH